MDDVIILGQDKETLHRWKAAVETFLREELALDLNSKTSIRPVRQGVEFVGVRIWPTHMKLRKSTVRRIKREVRKISALYAAGDMTRQDFYRRVASIRGVAKAHRERKPAVAAERDLPGGTGKGQTKTTARGGTA